MIKILLIILIISLLINSLFFIIDILPVIKRIIRRKQLQLIYLNPKHRTLDVEELIFKEALSMAESKKVTMPMSEQSHFLNEIRKLFNTNSKQNSYIYHYPKGYLFVGLTEYIMVKKDNDLLNTVVTAFETYINEDGTPKFLFDKVDQAPFGIAAINLFISSSITKYKIMADFIFQKLTALAEKNSGIIYYRPKSDVNYVDVIGMVCPFLVRYGVTFNNDLAINIARKQLQYYIKYGLETKSYLPSHALIRDSCIKVGSYNWGRGIGWFLIGLSEYIRFAKDPSFNNELIKLTDTLLGLRTKELVWTQFPGSSTDFDASATTMFMYSINSVSNRYSKREVLDILNKYILNGVISHTSGDTYSANRYSTAFGNSELTQGFLLMLLSSTEK